MKDTFPKKRLLILGGYGNTGRHIVGLLLRFAPNLHIIVAGRSQEKAEAFVKEVDNAQASASAVDASNPDDLKNAFQDVDLVLVASSTAAHTKLVAEAALNAGIDYLDIIYSDTKLKALRSIEEDVNNAGLCFITECGFHPGLPSAVVRYLAPSFGRIETANIGSVIKVDWSTLQPISLETLEEFVEELVDFRISVFKSGEWKDGNVWSMMTNPLYMDFGIPFGESTCLPMFLHELKDLPLLYPSLKETGFYIGGFNWVVDWAITPCIMLAMKVCPTQSVKRIMARFLYWGLKTFSSPPFGTRLKVEASGYDQNGQAVEKTLMISHDDGYLLTAIPIVATLLQYLATDGNDAIRKPGLWMQGTVVKPTKFMKDMEMMGAQFQPPLPSDGVN